MQCNKNIPSNIYIYFTNHGLTLNGFFSSSANFLFIGWECLGGGHKYDNVFEILWDFYENMMSQDCYHHNRRSLIPFLWVCIPSSTFYLGRVWAAHYGFHSIVDLHIHSVVKSSVQPLPVVPHISKTMNMWKQKANQRYNATKCPGDMPLLLNTRYAYPPS